jgi:glycerol-3-phosphate dehydrogenase
LVMRVIQDSIENGAHALNYTKVKNLVLKNGQTAGVTIEESDTGNTIDLSAAAVINATGAWADRLRNEFTDDKRIRPLRGSHLIFAQSLYPVTNVMTFLHQDDKRGVYVYPWEGTTVLGTTDLDHQEDLDIEASISDQEIEYLLNGFNRQFPNNQLSRTDILSSWAGVRPVIGADQGKDPSKERRDHAVWSDHGLITVSGGKLTTFRLIALDALAAAAEQLPTPTVVTDHRMFVSPEFTAAQLIPANPLWAQRLMGRYGAKAQQLLKQSSAQEQLSLGDTQFSLAECRWSVKYEGVIHLDDLLLRRTRLGMCLAKGGEEIMPALKNIFQQEQQWNEDRWNSEYKRYQTIWQRYYSLPNSL